MLSLLLQSQSDSVEVNELAYFNEGLYLSAKDLRLNSTIDKQNIESDLNKEQIDFYSKITSQESITVVNGNASYTLGINQVWGYVQNKTLFVNYNGKFFRIPVFGSICYFAGVIEVTGYYNGVYDPMFGPGGTRAVKTQEVREFIMNYYDGRIIPFNMEDLEKLLSRDKDLFDEYSKLNKRNRKKQASRYIRKYNELHPVYYKK
jgi:hypothetical protein